MIPTIKCFLSCVLATMKRWGPAVPSLALLGTICGFAWNGMNFMAKMSHEITTIRIKVESFDKSIEKVVDRVHVLERKVDVLDERVGDLRNRKKEIMLVEP